MSIETIRNLPTVVSIFKRLVKKFNALKSSELGIRLDSARSKMIAHKEINNNQGERALYNPTDFGLKWSDAKNILGESKELIYECNYIVNRTHVDLERSQHGNQEASNSFWTKMKNA